MQKSSHPFQPSHPSQASGHYRPWHAKIRFLPVALLASTILFTGCSSSDSDDASTANDTMNDPMLAQDSDILLSELDSDGQYIEIWNRSSTETIDVSGYFLCAGPGGYQSLGSATVWGTADLTAVAPGQFVAVQPTNTKLLSELQASSGAISLYINNSGFTNPDLIVDFIQWGSSGNDRENVADEAMIWESGTFETGYPPVAGQSLQRIDGTAGTAAWNVAPSSLPAAAPVTANG